MRKGILTTALAAVVFAVMLALLAAPGLAQSGVTNFTNLKISGDVTVGDDLTTAGDLVYPPNAVVVVTSGGTVTALSSHVPLSSTGTVGTASIAGPTAGRVLFLVNMANTTITFTDTGTLKLAGNAALGQYDTLTVRGDGTNWIEAARSNN